MLKSPTVLQLAFWGYLGINGPTKTVILGKMWVEFYSKLLYICKCSLDHKKPKTFTMLKHSMNILLYSSTLSHRRLSYISTSISDLSSVMFPWQPDSVQIRKVHKLPWTLTSNQLLPCYTGLYSIMTISVTISAYVCAWRHHL